MKWNKLINSARLRKSSKRVGNDPRNEFESDYGRLIFSPAVRRMHDKTQVFPLTADDNIHSRLTHSMEVMAIGYSLGIKLCISKDFIKHTKLSKDELFRKIPVILKSSCLVHDIGNPPFGHFGETVIQEYFKSFFERDKYNLELSQLEKEDFTYFDGNAQGFRVLTKLQMLDDLNGLNLTYGTLASYIKYPNSGNIDKTRLETKKRGIFQTEKEHFQKIFTNCGLLNKKIIRHPLSYLMEAADSICYNIMDIEDGFSKNLISLEYLKEELSKVESIKDAIKDIFEEKSKYGEKDTQIAKIRILLIQKLVDLAINNFISNLKDIESGEYNKELIEDDPYQLTKRLQDITKDKIFPAKEIISLELKGHSVIHGLLDFYSDLVFNKNKRYRSKAQLLISRSLIRCALMENNLEENTDIEELNDYSKLRIIVDYISGMTDKFALNHYKHISG